jgi:CheY-like chemotaxis protein
LLVEHEEALRTAIVKAFRARGIGVDPFSDALEALRAVESGQVWSRCLIDLSLPSMDGATLAEKILQHIGDMEVTFCTGGIDADVLCKAHALGTVIWKPLGLGPLCERFAAIHRSGEYRRGERGMERRTSSATIAVANVPATNVRR